MHMSIPETNALLIADPFLKDTHFQRAVVLLCNHVREGSLGFIINRKFHMHLHELMSGVDNVNIPVHVGGPVEMDSLHFIHQYHHLIPESVMINEHLAWGGDFEMTRELLNSNQINPSGIKFFIGYSGWSEGQLENEMKEKTWLLGKPSNQLIFQTPVDRIWKESVISLGETYRDIIHYPIDPQLN